eukprot:g1524.t1
MDRARLEKIQKWVRENDHCDDAYYDPDDSEGDTCHIENTTRYFDSALRQSGIEEEYETEGCCTTIDEKKNREFLLAKKDIAQRHSERYLKQLKDEKDFFDNVKLEGLNSKKERLEVEIANLKKAMLEKEAELYYQKQAIKEYRYERLAKFGLITLVKNASALFENVLNFISLHEIQNVYLSSIVHQCGKHMGKVIVTKKHFDVFLRNISNHEHVQVFKKKRNIMKKIFYLNFICEVKLLKKRILKDLGAKYVAQFKGKTENNRRTGLIISSQSYRITWEKPSYSHVTWKKPSYSYDWDWKISCDYFYLACKNGLVKDVQLIYNCMTPKEQKEIVNYKFGGREDDYEYRNSHSLTGLMLAVQNEHEDVVKYLLSLPLIDVSVTTRVGGKPSTCNVIHWAAWTNKKSKNIIKILLEHPTCSDAAINQICVANMIDLEEEGEADITLHHTPMDLAYEFNEGSARDKLIDMLRNRNGKKEAKVSEYAVIEAVERGNIALLKDLLNEQSSEIVNKIRPHDRWSDDYVEEWETFTLCKSGHALHFAVALSMNKQEVDPMLTLLLDHEKVNMNHVDFKGCTVLHLAATGRRRGSERVTSYLVNHPKCTAELLKQREVGGCTAGWIAHKNNRYNLGHSLCLDYEEERDEPRVTNRYIHMSGMSDEQVRALNERLEREEEDEDEDDSDSDYDSG